jgi:acetylornithine deacetylase/succinyl-diaminopimelate desuccinylase-like protein
LELEVVRLEGRTPLIFMTLPPTSKDTNETVLMYGHLDKQPPLTSAWKEGLGPHTPVIKDGKLYGRGGADDGYSTFAAINSVIALHEQGVPHGRIVVMIEACEESGSPDLPYYVDHLEKRIGVPSLIICLDSGCGNYEQFWLTTSLRGLVVGTLKVSILEEAAHSGHASGIVPDTFRIARHLISRVEDEKTGKIIPDDFYCTIPEDRKRQIKLCSEALGHQIYKEFAWTHGAGPVSHDINELITNRTWHPQLAIIGADGLPACAEGGNVLRTSTSIKLSLRIPPGVEPSKAAQALKQLLEKDVPYGAKVQFTIEKASTGWNSPPLAEWLEKSINNASNTYFKKPANFIGEGGSIPFMGMLGAKFPKAQFVITGVLGPESNAHGPNEMLHIGMGKGITACVASIVADHCVEFSKKH